MVFIQLKVQQPRKIAIHNGAFTTAMLRIALHYPFKAPVQAGVHAVVGKIATYLLPGFTQEFRSLAGTAELQAILVCWLESRVGTDTFSAVRGLTAGIVLSIHLVIRDAAELPRKL